MKITSKNFRRNFKKFRKNIHKYFCEDVIFDVRLGYIIEIGVTVIITALITAFITQARTIESIKDAQRDSINSELEPIETFFELCDDEVTVDGDINSNIQPTSQERLV